MKKVTYMGYEAVESESDFRIGSNRTFGLVVGGILMAVGVSGIAFSMAVTLSQQLLLGVGGILFVTALLMPSLLHPLNVAWMRLGWLLGKIVNPVVLAVMFYGFLTPLAICMRILGKTPISGRFNPAVETYWRYRDTNRDQSSSMKRQF